MDGVIRACARAGDDLASVRARVLYELGRVVSFDAAFLAAADPETLLFTAAFADDALVESGPRFLDGEYSTGPDVNRFATLARSDDPVASLDGATRGERASSTRWRQVIAPLGMGDEARVALRVDGETWGFLCLHRSGPTGFAPSDLAHLRRVAPHLGDAIRRTVIAGGGAPDATGGGDGQGLVVVADDRVVAMGGAAEYWLERLGGTAPYIGGPLPLPLLAVVRRLRHVEAGGGGGEEVPAGAPAALRLRAGNGAFVTVRATHLRHAGGEGSVALAIAPAGGAERASLLLSAHGLTAAQRRVAQLVLHGRSTRQIVLDLHISEHTVQDHLKAVFDKVGVRSRRDLVTALMRPSTGG